jgi:hypothetical protein
MYIIYSDLNSAGVKKTPYDNIIMEIPNMNWDFFYSLYQNKNNEINWDHLIIPSHGVSYTLAEKLGNYLFEYRFGFHPKSSACMNCCDSDYQILIADYIYEIKIDPKVKTLYCPNSKNQVCYILQHYFGGKFKYLNRIILNQETFDCSTSHARAIRISYKIDNPSYQLFETDNQTGFSEKNSLFEICLNKIRQEFFDSDEQYSKQMLKTLPFDIIYQL